MPRPHLVRLAGALAVLALPLGAQQRPAADTARRERRDSAEVRRLPDVTVTATLRPERQERVPWAVGVVGERELRRAQPTVHLDEALPLVPGVYVANRWNFAVDSRLAVRGFGSRANFGVRGVRVVLDGIPQTLPDGQSQTTNVELGALARVEVLRGASSALYGNGSGGVVSFTTDVSSPGPASGMLRVEGGSFGMSKVQARAAGRRGRLAGAVSVSRFGWNGFRPHHAAEVRQLNAGVDWALAPTTTASFRLNLADTPEALNPGALTAAEFAANPDSVAPANVLRGADKRTRQHQLSVRLHRTGDAGLELDASAFALVRDLRNALAVAPPAPASPANGTYVTIDRDVVGARVSAARRIGAAGPRVSAGVEWQRMDDLRENRVSTAGRPTAPIDTLLLSQDEVVSNVGPFVQLQWEPVPRVTLSAGGRHDWVRFAVSDRFASDGIDSGERTLRAWSGHLGASWAAHPAVAPYVNLSTSFETPTTTELQARPDGRGGFNDALDSQLARGVELGVRGEAPAGRLAWSAALFRVDVRDAIVQYLETNGRAYFTNAGRTRNEGAELGLDARLGDRLTLVAAYTWARYRFRDYQVVDGDVVRSLDGNALPGVPEHFLRVGVRTRPLAALTLDVDHTVSSAVWADDENTLRVEGWGPGVTAVRAAWDVAWGGYRLQPFAGAHNLFDRRYVSAVTVNGFGGRVREPGPGRSVHLGMEIGWSVEGRP